MYKEKQTMTNDTGVSVTSPEYPGTGAGADADAAQTALPRQAIGAVACLLKKENQGPHSPRQCKYGASGSGWR